jgi:aryl-phospho-beta-D-glucosidase BglC (GH1 family)
MFLKSKLYIIAAVFLSTSAVAQYNPDIAAFFDDPIERESPVTLHGKLYVCGTHLCNQNNKPVQLRGMSTHGLQWYGLGNCVTGPSLDALYYDWGADIVRISLYVQEGGYETNPVGFTTQVHTIIEEVTDRGMYAIVDWHQLTPGDPMYNLERAKTFFTDIAREHHEKTNIIYEIANEPNGVTWERIVEYADSIIPVIRRYDEDAVILIGTPGWSSLGISQGNGPQEIYNNPVTIDDNIMYTFHFYAASHGQAYRIALTWAAERLPIFVSEFGTQTYTGDGANNFASTQAYFDIMDEYKISWTNWNYSHDWRSGAVWKTGTCPSGPWTEDNLKEAGLWIRERIRERYITSVDDNIVLPETYFLEQNFPNPFNPVTVIGYRLSVNSYVILKIYDIFGREVVTLVDEEQSAGFYEVEFNIGAYRRFVTASGVYFYQLKAGEYTATKKMIVLK